MDIQKCAVERCRCVIRSDFGWEECSRCQADYLGCIELRSHCHTDSFGLVSVPIRDFQVNSNLQVTVTGFINLTLLIRSMTVSGRTSLTELTATARCVPPLTLASLVITFEAERKKNITCMSTAQLWTEHYRGDGESVQATTPTGVSVRSPVSRCKCQTNWWAHVVSHCEMEKSSTMQ